MTEQRTFSHWQRTLLFLAASGKCQACGATLQSSWHADHKIPWSEGGLTELENGQALCSRCNLAKGPRRPCPDAPESALLDLRLARSRRLQMSLTQQQLADRLGFDQATIANWELGKRVPSLDTLQAWADALGLPVAELILKPNGPKVVAG